MKPWTKNMNDKSAWVNIFSELRLTGKFWNYLRMNATSYIDFYTLIAYNLTLLTLIIIQHALITSSLYWFLQLTTVHVFYYAIKTIELKTREAVSFVKVFHWTKFLAFENKHFFTEIFHESLKISLAGI